MATPNVRIALTNVHERRAAFLEYRKSHIGSSDIAAIAGLDPWKSAIDVWAEKTGRIPPKEDTDTLWFGRQMETVVGELFTRRTGLQIERPCEVWQSNLYPWASMSPDFIVNSEAPLETKAPRIYQKKQWGEDQAPDSAHCQLQWQLGLSGYKYGYCGAIIGGSVLDAHFPRFDYDQEVFEQLLQLARRFYEDNLLKDVPPEPRATDGDVLDAIYPPNGDCAALQPEAEELFLKWEEIQRVKSRHSTIVKEVSEEADKIKNQFRILLGGARSGTLGNYRCEFREIPIRGFEVAPRFDVRFSAGEKGDDE